MTDTQTRLVRDNGRWHIMARKGAEGAAEAVWISLGGCPCQTTAIRVWLACLTMGKR
ncbi:hypothetical protein [Roseovarius arcticus]|uniref:hypothetical protein n=1 Tax=Roseovarius arcticus TaxID=2547404 RepID=UPI0014874038|nr:hypothetical protein [Roseovarius arcticus]